MFVWLLLYYCGYKLMLWLFRDVRIPPGGCAATAAPRYYIHNNNQINTSIYYIINIYYCKIY